MAKTQSEQLLEEYCVNSGLAFKRIPEGPGRTPDYELTIEGQRIIVEVKEIIPNKEEKESYKATKNTPGDRVRKKTRDSNAQVKARTEGIYPSILVLFDPHWEGIGDLSDYNIRVAMYGLEQMHLAVPRYRSVSPYPTGWSYGPKRKMTENDNTSISAVGVLFTPGPDNIALDVFHNKYAAVPLDRVLLAKHGIRQFELEDGVRATIADWKEVDIH